MNDNKTFPKESVPVVDKNFHGTDNKKAKGVTSEAMKKFGRNVARAKNQRG